MTMMLWIVIGVIAIAILAMFWMSASKGDDYADGMSPEELEKREAMRQALNELDVCIRNSYQAITMVNKEAAIEAGIEAAEKIKALDEDGMLSEKMNGRIEFFKEELFDVHTLHAKQHIAKTMERAHELSSADEKIGIAQAGLDFVMEMKHGLKGDVQVLRNLEIRLLDYIERFTAAKEFLDEGLLQEREKLLGLAAAAYTKALDIFLHDQINNYLMKPEIADVEEKVKTFDPFAYQQRQQNEQARQSYDQQGSSGVFR